MDRAAAREVAYAWRGVGDGGGWCALHGVLLCVAIRCGCCGILDLLCVCLTGVLLLILVLAGLHGRGKPSQHKEIQC